MVNSSVDRICDDTVSILIGNSYSVRGNKLAITLSGSEKQREFAIHDHWPPAQKKTRSHTPI
jgi:hypothetical protein